MESKEFKKLVKQIIVRVFVVALFIFVTAFITLNATVTNDIALEQLNGGNEGYLMNEAYNTYKTIFPYISAALFVWVAYAPIKTIYIRYKEIKKENNNENI